jgi:hypothetical protein
MINIVLGKDGSILTTKDEILQKWKCSLFLNNAEIVQMLNSIEQKLNSIPIQKK